MSLNGNRFDRTKKPIVGRVMREFRPIFDEVLKENSGLLIVSERIHHNEGKPKKQRAITRMEARGDTLFLLLQSSREHQAVTVKMNGEAQFANVVKVLASYYDTEPEPAKKLEVTA